MQYENKYLENLSQSQRQQVQTLLNSQSYIGIQGSVNSLNNNQATSLEYSLQMNNMLQNVVDNFDG